MVVVGKMGRKPYRERDEHDEEISGDVEDECDNVEDWGFDLAVF